jgi:hypothetical protein
MADKDPLHSDSVKLLNNETTTTFRVERVPCRLAVDGPGLLQSWQGDDWDAGERFAGSDTIIAPGYYQITLDGAGYVTLQEPSN